MAKEPLPQEELARLERGLATGLAPGYALRGGEPWFAGRALALLRRVAGEAGLELCRHDGSAPDFAPAALLDDLCGTAMFAPARCVVLSGADEHLKRTGKEEAPALRAMRSFLGGRRGTLVLVSESLRVDSPALRAIEQAGGALFTFRPLWDAPPSWDPDPFKTELVAWVLARARELSVRLSREQALLLSKAKGNDLAALDAELVRVRAAGAEAAVVLESDAAGSPLRLSDMLAAGDAPAALVEIERLWRSGFQKGKGLGRQAGTPAILSVLFGGLRRGVRQGLIGATALASGADPKLAADEAGVPTWPKARQEFRERVGARTPREWRAMYADLLALERRSRSTAVVDENDLFAYALRWRRARAGAPAQVRGAWR